MGTYVIGTGGDYLTINAAETALTLPEVGGTVYQFTGTITAADTLNDADYVNGLTLEAKAGEEADGAGNGARYNALLNMNITTGALVVRNIRLQRVNLSNATGTQVTFDDCVLGEGTTADTTVGTASTNVLFTNCILQDGSDDNVGNGVDCPSMGYEQCTFVDASSYNVKRAKVNDCLALGGGVGDYILASAGSDYNAASDTSAPGTAVYNSRTTADLVDYAGGDYNLASGSSLNTSGTGGIRIGANLATTTGLTLDSTPTDINCQTQESFTVSNATTAPTTSNTSVKFDDTNGQPATVNSVVDNLDGSYDINATWPRTTAKKFSVVGYPVYIGIDDAPVTEPGNPLYVATTGSDLTGDGSEGNPWRTPEFGAKQLTAGDTLVIQSGTYVLDATNLPVGETTTDRDRALVSPSRNVSGTALNPITIKGAAGASVFLDAGASPQWPAAGTNGGDYLVLDNVTIRGCAILWGSDNSVVKNCDLYGGIDTPTANGGDNFGCVLRVENTTNAVVRNNLLRDNQLGITQDNSPLLMCYSSTGLVVENNDVYSSVGMGLRFKDEPNNVTVRYNYIYDNVQSGISSSNQVQGYNIDIYQNVIRNNNTANNGSHGGIRCNILVSGWNIYNNTFYENGYADVRALYDTTDDINLWNNIHSNSVHFYRAGFSSTGSQFSTVITYSDYNQFHNGGDWQTRSTNYTTLASYSSGETLDSNSLDTDPNFVNAGGLTAEDYKRTSYPANGRSGAYEDVMGAYVTGNEAIGVSA